MPGDIGAINALGMHVTTYNQPTYLMMRRHANEPGAASVIVTG